MDKGSPIAHDLPPTAWITGAAGFIGRHLVRHLTDIGVRVGGIDVAQPTGGLGDVVAAWRTGAVAGEVLSSLADETGLPAVIYHLAGGSSVGTSLAEPYADFGATVGGTAVLLEWLRSYAAQVPLVIISSAAVYGNRHAGPITDDAVAAPFSPYGAHKHAMEIVCRGWAESFALKIVGVRLFSVYGPGLSKQLLWDLCGKLAARPNAATLGGSGAEVRDWTHVDDVVRALVAAAPLASHEMPIVNAGSGVGRSVRAIAELVVRSFGGDPACLRFSGSHRPGDPFSLVAAPGALEAGGFRWRIAPERGVGDYVRWYRERSEA